jgi:hypothetical protein
MEKTFEFESIKEFGECKDVNQTNIDTLEMHYDKDKKKYITTIKYEKKAK